MKRWWWSGGGEKPNDGRPSPEHFPYVGGGLAIEAWNAATSWMTPSKKGEENQLRSEQKAAFILAMNIYSETEAWDTVATLKDRFHNAITESRELTKGTDFTPVIHSYDQIKEMAKTFTEATEFHPDGPSKYAVYHELITYQFPLIQKQQGGGTPNIPDELLLVTEQIAKAAIKDVYMHPSVDHDGRRESVIFMFVGGIVSPSDEEDTVQSITRRFRSALRYAARAGRPYVSALSNDAGHEIADKLADLVERRFNQITQEDSPKGYDMSGLKDALNAAVGPALRHWGPEL